MFIMMFGKPGVDGLIKLKEWKGFFYRYPVCYFRFAN